MHNFFTQDPFVLPAFLSENYEVDSFLKHSEESAVCLLKEKRSRRYVLLKYSDDPLIQRTYYNEKELLDTIHTDTSSRQKAFFPKTILLKKSEQTVYYIRSYITGRTLEDLCESNQQQPGISEDLVLDYAIHLAEQLHFLHSMTPPVIHRDIKPQNVIVDDAGNCHFIDMGISRFFDRSQSRDTLIMGTQQIAPPEQFGFRQTDTRSDIYSLGVLIYYCITGEYGITEEGMGKISLPSRKIIQKATMFDPDQRYENVTSMLEELLRVRFHPYLPTSEKSKQKSPKNQKVHTSSPKRRTVRILLCIFAALLLLGCVYFFILLPNSRYSFAEPLIEQAVCQQLDKEPGTVTRKDLRSIEELHIFGQQIYESDDQVWIHGDDPWFYADHFQESGLYRQQGSISQLDDISYMTNLDRLCLYNQQISDISALSDTDISYLGLGYNPLTDLSPLTGNENVTTLIIPDLALSDYNVLKTLKNLQCINLGNNPITSLECLMGCPLTDLDLYLVNLEDYSQIRQFPELKTLKLNWIDQNIMAQLYGMKISDLQFFYSKNFSLSDINGLPELRNLTFFGDQGPLHISEEPINLPNLQYLLFTFTQLSDFSSFSQLKNLRTLLVHNAELLDAKGLDQIPNLEFFDCAPEHVDAIRAQYPDADFKIY